jgi:transposase
LLRGRDVQELKELQRQGISIQAISELTGWDRKTIRKYVQAAGVVPEYGPHFPALRLWSRSDVASGPEDWLQRRNPSLQSHQFSSAQLRQRR